MIETRQTVSVGCGIDETWAYARDFQRWASIMPGYQSCEMQDQDTSLWTLKVGVGAMVRTVKVRVHVDEWAGPERVDFTYKLEGDPVAGRGSYSAASGSPSQTDMTLHVEVRGSGPMAPMWEAMGGPVLPRFARSFAEQLRDRIEEHAAALVPHAAVAAPPRSLLSAILAWLRSAFRKG